MKQISFRSLLAIWIPAVAVALSFLALSQARAAPLQFTESIYEALDAVESQDFGKYKKSLEYLLHADEFAYRVEARDKVRQAAKVLLSYANKTATAPTDSELANLKNMLGDALIANRVTLNSTYLEESKLLENLMKVRFFKENYDRVQVTYENTTRDKAMSLILAYLVDPRAAKYDPEVAALLTGKNLDGSDSDHKIVFHLPEQIIATPAGRNSAEVAAELQKDFEGILQGTPFKPHIRELTGDSVTLTLELAGLEYLGVAEFYLRNVLAMVHGNRWLLKAANGLEYLSINANSPSLQGPLKTLAQASAQPLATMAGTIKDRLKLATKGFVDVTDEKVVALETERAADAIYRLPDPSKLASSEQKAAIIKQYGLNMVDDAVKDSAGNIIKQESSGAWKWVQGELKDAAGNVIKKDQWYYVLTDQSLEFIAKYKDDLELLEKDFGPAGAIKLNFLTRLQHLATELENLRRSPEWRKLMGNPNGQERLEVKMAEEALGIKVATYDWTVKVLTGGIALFHTWRLGKQSARAQSTDERRLIREEYIPKIFTDLLYIHPAVMEGAVCWEFGFTFLNHTLFKMLGGIQVPDIESSARWAYRTGIEAMYWMRGTTRFKEQKKELEKTLQIPEFSQRHGKWTFPALDQVFDSKPEELVAKKTELREQLGQVASKYAALLYILNDRSQNRYERVLGQYESDLNRSFFIDAGSFMSNIKGALAESK